MLAPHTILVLDMDMSEHSLTSPLPETKLGKDRYFKIGHSYHGDLVVSSWQGADEAKVTDITSFGFAHGSDTTILAAFAGYLRRSGRSNADVGEIMREAGGEVLCGEVSSLHGDSFSKGMLSSVARGDAPGYFDDEALGLQALGSPIPRVPGLIEEVGGTAMYTRDDGQPETKLFVFAQYPVFAEAPVTAEFCQEDIPTMAKLACNLALGDYRRDIGSFLRREYPESLQ